MSKAVEVIKFYLAPQKYTRYTKTSGDRRWTTGSWLVDQGQYDGVTADEMREALDALLVEGQVVKEFDSYRWA